MTILIYISSTQDPSHFVTDKHLAELKEQFSSHTILLTNDPSDEELAQTEVILSINSLKTLDMTKLPNLKWVQVATAGIDSLPESIKDSEILVTNASGVHPIPISEHIFTFMLMFTRGMPQTTRAQHKKEWTRTVTTSELHGKTIGIIGLGRIGAKTAALAKAFDMRVLAIAKHTNQEANADKMLSMDALSELLKESDFVVNCLPGTEETRGLFNEETFKQMKETSYFINIGRGFSVVETDLIKALENKQIAGAGLDVFETEPLAAESPLWEMEQVIITPHIAGKTPFYMDRVLQIFSENMKAYLSHDTMPTLVDKKVGY